MKSGLVLDCSLLLYIYQDVGGIGLQKYLAQNFITLFTTNINIYAA